MIKMLWRLGLLLAASALAVWLADSPTKITLNTPTQDIQLSVLAASVIVAAAALVLFFAFWILRGLWKTPAHVRGRRRERKTKKAYEALSLGIIAAGAGDARGAARHAAIAAETLPHEPLVKLLGAQAAQLRGDKPEVRKVFEIMAQKPETELLGLRGLFAQARDAGDWQAARRHAEAAHGRNKSLPWAATAVLQSLLAHKDWEAAARCVAQQAKSGLMPRDEALHKQAALLAAAAIEAEGIHPPKALELAVSAHGLDASLVPASASIARLQIAAGQNRKALKALKETWAHKPHRLLAALAAQAVADEPEKQFERVRELVGQNPESTEGRYALARAAIAAQRFEAARDVLAPLMDNQPPVSICGLMAELEDAAGAASKSRDWLARAMHAPRDPLWVSDGVANAQWRVTSPVTGEIAPSEWRVPFEQPLAPQLSFNGSALAAKTALPPEKPGTGLPRPPDDPGIEQGS